MLREAVKRALPHSARDLIAHIRQRLAAPPLEQITLHPYAMTEDVLDRPRLTLAMPSLAPEKMFGGVATAIELFLEWGRRDGARLRILVDDFDARIDRGFLDKLLRRTGVDASLLAIENRTARVQPLAVARHETFIAFNWWTALNLRAAQDWQVSRFGGPMRPLIYLVQEYEPAFYPMSSTHMFARAAFDSQKRAWGVFNSSQLHAYFRRQGHGFEHEFVFEPRLSASLTPYLSAPAVKREKQILVYGRPNVPRNCFPAIVEGLKAWARRDAEEAGTWKVVSAGTRHRPIALGGKLVLTSLGKLSLDEYALQLRRSAVGVALMASPHPSYPPLEMAHFGMRTLTNLYACKDLAAAHENIVSLPDLFPDTLADALSDACRRPRVGEPHATSFTDASTDPYAFLDALRSRLSQL